MAGVGWLVILRIVKKCQLLVLTQILDTPISILDFEVRIKLWDPRKLAVLLRYGIYLDLLL